MKTSTVCIVSFLLLCSSCQIEQQPRDFFEQEPHTISIDSDGWSTFQVVMPDNWKIVDAQLNLNPSNKEFNLHLEFDRGKGIEKHSIPASFPPEDYTEDIRFIGANRIDGLAFLHFNKKEPQIDAKSSLGISRIKKDAKFREIILAYRNCDQLTVHLLAENTPFGTLMSHNLRHYYYGETENDDHTEDILELNKGVLQFNFGENYKGNPNFPIHKLVKLHEELGSGSVLYAKGEIRLQVTSHYELVSKDK